MSGRAAKQSYLGRVISPARYHDGKNGSKPYLSFQIFVDRLAVKAEDKRERTSGKIFCSYSVQSDNDPVAFILCNILDSKTGSGSINGQTYKSVEVWVEGNEKLTEVKAFDSEGKELNGSYYKSLEYCTVQILDRDLVRLLKQGQDGSGHTTNSTEAQANVAPSMGSRSRNAVQPQPQEQVANRTVYAVGARITDEGKTYEFIGGDSSSMSNWVVVTEDEPVTTAAPATPFAAPASTAGSPVKSAPKTTASSNPFRPNANAGTSSIRSMLEEDGDSDGPQFGDPSSRPPV